jgi:hypothetical protein
MKRNVKLPTHFSQVSLVLRAIDNDARPGHPAGPPRYQESHDVSDLLRSTHPALSS